MNKKEKFILEQLNIMFPNAKGELDHKNNFELLVAVVLSAQTTDVQVNIVTKELFKKYPTPEKLAEASISDVENLINSIGLYRNKAKNIIGLSKMLVNNFNGIVPDNRESLESLPGVGRKTANVVLSIAFDIPQIAVDTHVNRVSKRLGLAEESDSLIEVENKLMKKFDKSTWTKLHHQLIFFGRYHCKAAKPNCKECPLVDICTYDKKNIW